MDGQVPPSTRVVIDLEGAGSNARGQHELVAGPNGSFVLTIHDSAVAHRQAAPATKAVADSVAPQMARASAPVVSAPAPLAPAPAMVASAPASAQNSEKPSDFAFV